VSVLRKKSTSRHLRCLISIPRIVVQSARVMPRRAFSHSGLDPAARSEISLGL
jgi:hypothetical protein